MPSVLDEFRAQVQAVEEVKARMTEVAGLLRVLTTQAHALTHDPALRQVLTDEQTWLSRAQELVSEIRQFRERETGRFWPATRRRWAMAMILVLITVLAGSAAYVWAARPCEAELVDLRDRAAFGDAVAARVVQMTPEEKRRFDALMAPRPVKTR